MNPRTADFNSAGGDHLGEHLQKLASAKTIVVGANDGSSQATVQIASSSTSAELLLRWQTVLIKIPPKSDND